MLARIKIIILCKSMIIKLLNYLENVSYNILACLIAVQNHLAYSLMKIITLKPI